MPGVILFAFGYPIIVSWWSMLLLPITLVIFGLLRWWQQRHVFQLLEVDPVRDARGFAGFLLMYQVFTSSAALRGYAQFVRGASRRWR